MTPLNNSLFAICLFLSLSCLLKWTERRRLRALRFRRNLAAALLDGVAERRSGATTA
jgi:hypothetical protein